LAGATPDTRSDLYSLGISLFEMLSGRLPWDSTEISEMIARKRSGPLASVRAFAPQVPSEVAHLIARLTASEPLRRPHTAREAVQSLVKLEIATLAERLPR
jgi:serine/threonine-protein kinase